MKYAEFRARERFDLRELLAFAHGTLVDDAPEGFTARLPTPPMLMLDRVVEISRQGNRGRVVGERDVRLDDWFFQCHFLGDPVQPGWTGSLMKWQWKNQSSRRTSRAALIFPRLFSPLMWSIRSTISIGGTGSRALKPSGGSLISRP